MKAGRNTGDLATKVVVDDSTSRRCDRRKR